ncbi:WXG100-like domain-containing protein [Nonomuraea sp. NPDC002799]
MLPPELSGFMNAVGMPWPNIDEDMIRGDATAWRTVLAGADTAGAEADASVRRTQQVYRGDSATSFAGQWNKLSGEDGHLLVAAAATRLAPVALDGTAAVVSAVKVAVGTQAAAGLAAVTQMLAFGGAAGVTMATARMLMTRQAMGKAMREGGEGTAKVLAPALSRRVTAPMRRILDNLRRPGGPGGGPALAGAGGRTVPMRPSGLRTSSGPRSAEDGMAKMGRQRNRDGDADGTGDNGLNQSNRKPHRKGGSKSSRDRHQNADAHGGKRRIPRNKNKKQQE